MENGHEPATKQNVIDALKATEAMRDVQTEILTAFYGYTQTTDAN
jgi:hypothetical protein